jgi:hypothetical protein
MTSCNNAEGDRQIFAYAICEAQQRIVSNRKKAGETPAFFAGM